MNIRTVILSVVFVVILMLTAGLVTAETKVRSDTSRNGVKPEIQEQSIDLEIRHSAPSYRSQFGECFDVSIKELAACRDESQKAAQSHRSPIDECFDVSISELTACRNESQAPAP